MYHLKASSPHQFLQLLRNFQEASFSLLLFLRVQGCISCYPWNKASLLCSWCCTDPIHSHPQQPLRRVPQLLQAQPDAPVSVSVLPDLKGYNTGCGMSPAGTVCERKQLPLKSGSRSSQAGCASGDSQANTRQTTLIKFGKQQILQKTSDLGKRGRTWQRTIEIL